MPGSELIGKCVRDLNLRSEGANLLAVERMRDRRRTLLQPTHSFHPEAGDILLLDVIMDQEACNALIEKFGVEELPLSLKNAYFADLSQDIGMTEAIIPAESSLVGKTVRDSRLRTAFSESSVKGHPAWRWPSFSRLRRYLACSSPTPPPQC